MNKLLLLGLLLLVYSCHSQSKSSISPTKNSTMSTTNSTLAQQIAKDQFGDFFNYAVQEEVMDRIWTTAGESSKPLEQIVLDKQAPNKARLIASEILLQQDFTIIGNMDMPTVTRVYTTALAENSTGMANSWGLLYEEEDMGPVGGTFSVLGEDALPALVELLDNKTRYLYEGSEAATVGNAYQFQVRDFAAYYISEILNEPSLYHADRAARDQEIERLKLLVQKR